MTETVGDKSNRPEFRVLVREIAAKSFPLYLSMLASVIGSLVTVAVMGNFSTASLAALALATAVFNPTVMAVQGALRGSMPFVAENGESPEALPPVVRNGIWLALVVGAVGALVVALVPVGARLIGVPAPTLSALGLYPALLAVCLVCTALQSSATVMLTGLGHSTATMTVGLTNTGLSVTLIPLLVLGAGPVPSLGLSGAGLAMLLASLVTSVAAHLLLRRVTVLAGRPIGVGRPHWREIWGVARVGLPMGSSMLIKFGVMGVLTVAAVRVGVVEGAAHQVLVVLMTFVFLSATAVGQASVPFMVRRVKEGDRTGTRSALAAGVSVALPVVMVSGLLVWGFVDLFLPVFTSDHRVRALVVDLMPVVLLVLLADGTRTLPGFGLLALKRTAVTLYTFGTCYGLLALLALPIAETGGLRWLWFAHAATAFGLFVGQTGGFWRLSASVGKNS